MKFKLAIFDLDGTLSDSFPWFLRIVNEVAERHGFRRIIAHEVDTLRALGSRAIVKSFGVPLWKLPAIARDMRALKQAHLDDIPLFPGVDRMLQRLSKAGVVIAIVSSDNEANSRRALGPENESLVGYFECGASLFGKAAKFRRVLNRSGIPAAQAICIGDEVRDVEAAHKAGIAFGGVTWGYALPAALQAHGADMMFGSMDEIADRLAGVRSARLTPAAASRSASSPPPPRSARR